MLNKVAKNQFLDNIVRFSASLFIIALLLMTDLASTTTASSNLIALFQAFSVAFILLLIIPMLQVSRDDWLSPGAFFFGMICLLFVFEFVNYLLWISLGRDDPSDLVTTGWINIVGILCIAFIYVVMGRATIASPCRAEAGKSISQIHFTYGIRVRLLLLLLLLITLTGGYNILLGFQYIYEYFFDPNTIRSKYSAAATGLGWLSLKQGYNLAGISFLMLLWRPDLTSYALRIAISLTLIIFVFSLFSLYGGRWLPFSLLLFLFVLWNRFFRRVSLKSIIVFFMALFAVSVLYAGYRYISQHDQDMTLDKVAASYFRQASGANAELAQVLSNLGAGDARTVFLHETAEAGLPTPIFRLVFGTDKEQSSTLGAYLAKTQDRLDAGGLRVTMFGDLYLAFGFYGVIILGLIIGALLRYLDHLYISSSSIAIYTALLALVQLISVYLIGFSKIFGAAQLVVVTAVFLLLLPKQWFRCSHRAPDNSSPLRG